MLAAFLAGELEGYDCRICTEELKDHRGCTTDTERPILEFEDGTALLRCPARSLTPEIVAVGQAYGYKQKGVFPVQGGWLDQSGTLLDALDLLDQEIGSYAKKS